MNKKQSYLIVLVVFLLAGSCLAADKVITPDLSKITAGDGWTVFNRKASVIEQDDKTGIYFDGHPGAGGAWLDTVDFDNGEIECDIKGKSQRPSFVGIAFHVLDANNFDAVYFRAFNFRNEARKQNSVQYISHPEHTWWKLREDSPGKYESAIEPAPDPDGFFHVKLVIENPKVSVFVNNAEKPTLIVEELSSRAGGKIGLWVDNESDGSFANLRITSKDNTENLMDRIAAIAKSIQWDDQASMTVQCGGKTICFDPYQVKDKKQADIVLITHAHQDHMSPGDIAKVITDKTILVVPADCASTLKQRFNREIITLNPGQKHTVGDIQIEAVPAYNIGKNYHPKGNNWVGYIVTIDGVRIYHAGDTNRIPEMKDFTCDIAMLPLGQTYTMDSVDEAVQAALDVKAKIAIPMHYGTYEGSNEDAVKFKQALEGKCMVIVKEKK